MDTFKRINVAEAKQIIDSRKVSVVDIRDAGTFLAGHMPGAVNLDDSNLEGFIRETDKARPVICCCYHGHSSQRAAAFFAEQGFTKVYSLDGGYEEWKKNDL